jgi:hypothetical protein
MASRGPLNADVRHRMSRLSKGLLIVEVATCFLPIAIMLGLGILMVPIQLWYLATNDNPHVTGPLFLFAYVAAGICGLIALYCVMRWLLYGLRAKLNPHVVFFLMCIGVTPLIYVSLQPDVLWRFAVTLPLLCTAHLLWLSRNYLFGDA